MKNTHNNTNFSQDEIIYGKTWTWIDHDSCMTLRVWLINSKQKIMVLWTRPSNIQAIRFSQFLTQSMWTSPSQTVLDKTSYLFVYLFSNHCDTHSNTFLVFGLTDDFFQNTKRKMFTCWGYFTKVNLPRKDNSRLSHPALHGKACQCRETEYYSKMDQGHEQRKVEVLRQMTKT